MGGEPCDIIAVEEMDRYMVNHINRYRNAFDLYSNYIFYVNRAGLFRFVRFVRSNTHGTTRRRFFD